MHVPFPQRSLIELQRLSGLCLRILALMVCSLAAITAIAQSAPTNPKHFFLGAGPAQHTQRCLAGK